MRPVDAGVDILGASSDHMMLDVTDSARAYRVGDPVTFELGYFSLMRAFTSAYVDKRYLLSSGDGDGSAAGGSSVPPR